jgi:hypothetical protein
MEFQTMEYHGGFQNPDFVIERRSILSLELLNCTAWKNGPMDKEPK